MDNAKRYSCLKYTLSIAETAYLLCFLFLIQKLMLPQGVIRTVVSRVGDTLVFPAYLFIFLVIYSVVNFPLHFYRSFIIEHQFGLSRQGKLAWLADQLKAGAVAYLIALTVFSAFYFILRHNPQNWWIIVALFWAVFNFLLAGLLPVVIIPLFFKYKPLSNLILKQRIISLANNMNVKILDVFEIDLSSKTLKANAAFVGWGKSRRVLLSDTLKDRYTEDEIEVILAHEFAHYKLRHLLKLLLVNTVLSVFLFYLIYRTSGIVLGFFNLADLSDAASLPVVIMYSVVFGLIMQPLGNFISRKFEYNADIVAIKTTNLRNAFISMMNKLGEQNLADRNPHPIIKFFFFDHPPVDERVESAKSL